MRWEDLFADLEAQAHADEAVDLRAEVADRTRRELARVALADRLAAHLGRDLSLGVNGLGPVHGRLVDVATQWLLVEEGGGRSTLVPSGACLWVQGLGRSAQVASDQSVRRRSTLAAALRALAVQRVSLTVHLVDGSRLSGTIDRVHADHVDLAEHPIELARRPAAVVAVRAVAHAAVAAARSC
jgi:hypothetical protein